MKTIITLLLIALGTIFSYAQRYTLTEVGYLHNMSKLGEPELNKENILGTPYIFDRWQKGEILTQDKRRIIVNKINYNTAKQKFYYKIKNDYFELFPDQIRFIIVRSRHGSRIFIPSLPYPIDSKYKGYFEVFTLEPQKMYVAKWHKRSLEPANKSQSYASDKSMEKLKYYDKSRIFVLLNGQYVKAPSSLKKLIKLLDLTKEEAKRLKNYIKQNNLHYKRPGDIQKIMDFYYSEIKKSK